MAKAVMTKIGRQKLCKAHAGDLPLPKIKQMAIGDGGVDESGAVIPVTGNETALKSQLFIKDVDSHIYPVDTTCRYSLRIGKEELKNKYLSEQGLIDEDGDLIAYKTFMPKGKDDDMEFVFEMDEIF